MIKTAVIGVGSMGRQHARVYRELPEADFCALCDPDPGRRETAARLLGVRAYSDARQMLEAEKPQAVSVAVPAPLHAEVSEVALQAGAHVLVEKPIAGSLEDARRMIECAHQNQRLLMVGHILRFNPALKALKTKLDAGRLGRIFQVACRRVGPYPRSDQGVSVAVDLAPHDIDLMRYLTGLEPLRVYAETGQRLQADRADLLLGLLGFPGGVSGSLEINWLTPTKVREVWVLGDLGLFRCDDLTQDLYFYANAQAGEYLWPSLQTLKGVSEGEMTKFALERSEPLKAELHAFLEAVRTGGPAPVSGEDGLQALRVALALEESGQAHQVIDLATWPGEAA